MAGGYDESKLAQGFGRTWTICDPGVSIKPYPSGILTHQSMDAMLKLVTDHDVKPAQVDKITFFAGKNIIEPIRYPFAVNHLQAKFSMAALLTMMVLSRRAGRLEFTDANIKSAAFVDMQKRIAVVNDPAIDAMGYDLIRSRIELTRTDGTTVTQWADERYRGGPLNPMTIGDIEHKFAAATDGLIGAAQQRALLDLAWKVETLPDAAAISQAHDLRSQTPTKLPLNKPSRRMADFDFKNKNTWGNADESCVGMGRRSSDSSVEWICGNRGRSHHHQVQSCHGARYPPRAKAHRSSKNSPNSIPKVQ